MTDEDTQLREAAENPTSDNSFAGWALFNPATCRFRRELYPDEATARAQAAKRTDNYVLLVAMPLFDLTLYNRLQASEAERASLEAQLLMAREALERIAGRAHSDPYPEAFANEPPMWARDPFNDDCASTCGYCGSWMTVVRPGKVQCDTCSDGQDLGALARSELRRASEAHARLSGGNGGWEGRS